MKYCSGCKQHHDESEFNKNKSLSGGLQFYCRKFNEKKYFERIKPILPYRICVLPDCSKMFMPKQSDTFWCRPHHKVLAERRGIELREILPKDSPSKLPQRAWVGAEESECVVL